MRFKRRGIIYAPPLIMLTLIMIIISFDPGGLHSSLREKAFDTYQKIKPRTYTDPKDKIGVGVKFAAIDEASLVEIGHWPWPRNILARLIDNAAKAGAAGISFDILLSEKDRFNPENDILLAQSFRQIPSIIGFAYTRQPKPDTSFKSKSGLAVNGPKETNLVDIIPHFAYANPPLEIFQNNVSGIGSVDVPPDPDGITRRLPVLLGYNEEIRTSLFLETLRTMQGATTIVVRLSGAQGEALFEGQPSVKSVRAGAVTIPTDHENSVRIYFTDIIPERTISAADIIKGRLPAESLKNTILVVGGEAAGLGDVRATPRSPLMPGPLIHVEAIEQALIGDFLTRPDWSYGLEISITLLIGLLLLFTLKANARRRSILAVAFIFIPVCASWYCFSKFQFLIDPTAPLFTAILIFSAGAAGRAVIEEADKRQITNAFEKYLPKTLVERLAAEPDQLQLGGETRVVTAFFCDIQGFTSLSEKWRDEPEKLTSFLNRFMTLVSKEIAEQEGTIDKFIGDCVMALWNAPLHQNDHALRACKTALKIMEAVDELNAIKEPDVPEIRLSIGIETGLCIIGNMGSEERFDYTAIGEAVNMAARLQSMASERDITCLIGETCGQSVISTNSISGHGFSLSALDIGLLRGFTRVSQPSQLMPL